jgi:hypothetical protein
VRDLDAHDWIEVYFQGYGWVPFNPTPAGSPATLASRIDPLAPSLRGAMGGLRPSAVLVLALAILAAAEVLRRRPRGDRDRMQELLERVARRTGARLGPSTTLSELGDALQRVGPHTAALAAEIERARFAAAAPERPRHPRLRVVRSLLDDLGPLRALLVFVPGWTTRPRAHHRLRPMNSITKSGSSREMAGNATRKENLG